MRDNLMNEMNSKYEGRYLKRTNKSREITERAKKYMPGGDTRASIFFQPYPFWIGKANGCRINDIDGNEYIDFHNCYTALVHGHANPAVLTALREQMINGTAHGALVPIVVRWAEILCERLKSVERIRFVNSGTEAVMMAIRAARGFTGKDKIIKTEYGYHGSYDPVVHPSNAKGLPKSSEVESITIPFNDRHAAERAVKDNKDQLAALIVESLMGSAGFVTPEDGYLNFLREITIKNNLLFILDEVQSFRLDYGGMQKIAAISPDITVLGKLIGGGLPVGAFGGRLDIMNQFSPSELKIYHGGTLNANPMTASAGVATLEQLTTKEIAKINALGEMLAGGFRKVFSKYNIKGQVTGYGSLQNIHFSNTPIVNGKNAAEANKEILRPLHFALMERGIFYAGRGTFSVSTPTSEKEIEIAIKAMDDAMGELVPYAEELWPDLLG
ncbi:aspartate aminotransferase family protein [Chloroflexota bacterium]